jgi:hypothetical protein
MFLQALASRIYARVTCEDRSNCLEEPPRRLSKLLGGHEADGCRELIRLQFSGEMRNRPHRAPLETPWTNTG